MFSSTTQNGFNGDLSEWDVSSVTDMHAMFLGATAFNGDISKWDVSSVNSMENMFSDATTFEVDISKWDVSSVTNMDYMFGDAALFNQKLCGAAWVHSKASKTNMFEGSSGSISRSVCTSDSAPANAFTTHEYVSRRPIPERELIVRTPIIASVNTPATTSAMSNTRRCPKCGTFKKSGRVSCCAPGGAWFKNCGGDGNANVDRRWFEGVEACKRKFEANGIWAQP